VDFGWQVRQIFGDGSEWPVLVYAAKMQPTITIETLMPEALATATVEGTLTAVSITIAKQATGAGRAGIGDLTITCAQQFVHVDSVGGGPGAEAATRLTITPSSNDGTTSPISIV